MPQLAVALDAQEDSAVVPTLLQMAEPTSLVLTPRTLSSSEHLETRMSTSTARTNHAHSTLATGLAWLSVRAMLAGQGQGSLLMAFATIVQITLEPKKMGRLAAPTLAVSIRSLLKMESREGNAETAQRINELSPMESNAFLPIVALERRSKQMGHAPVVQTTSGRKLVGVVEWRHVDQTHVARGSTYSVMETLEGGAKTALASKWPQQVGGPVCQHNVAKERLHSMMANVKLVLSSRELKMVARDVALIHATPGKDWLRMVHANIAQQDQQLLTVNA